MKMKKESKILGNPEEQKGIEELLRQAGKDSRINDIIEGKKAIAVHKSVEDVILERAPLEGDKLIGVNSETLAFNYNNYLAVAGYDNCLRAFHFVEMKTRQMSFVKVAEEQQTTPVKSIAFSKDNYLAVAYEDNFLRFFMFCMTIDPLKNKNMLNTFIPVKGKVKFTYNIKKLEFVGNILYIGFENGEIQEYAGLAPSETGSVKPTGYKAAKMAFSQDGKYVAVHHDMHAIVFKYPELEEIGRGYSGYTDDDAMAFIPGYNILTIGRERFARFYEFDPDKKKIKHFDGAKVVNRNNDYVDKLHTIKALAFSPDGKYLAVGNPEHVKIFDVKFNERTN